MPADPPPPSGPSSRSAPEAAGWGRPPAGPTPRRRLRHPPFAARNTLLARLLGDPTEEARLLWLRRLDEWARAEGVPCPPADRVVNRFARLDRASVAVLGDPGAGRGIQNAVGPVLLAAAGDTDLAVACGDIGAPCFAATGAGGPVLEDRARGRRDGGLWRWADESASNRR